MRFLIPILMAAVLTACIGAGPKTQLAGVEVAFTRAVNELNFNCQVGTVEEQVCRDAVPIVAAGSAALDAAHVALTKGDTQAVSDGITEVRRQIRLLNAQVAE